MRQCINSSTLQGTSLYDCLWAARCRRYPKGNTADSKVQVENLGETDFIIEYVQERKKRPVWEYTKVVLVCMMIFFGSAFSIMTFNADVSVDQVFGDLHRLMTGQERTAITWLEGGYAAGLFLGILIFYNHFRTKKRVMDPTPLEVEIREYERTVNQSILDQNERIKSKQKRRGERV